MSQGGRGEKWRRWEGDDGRNHEDCDTEANILIGVSLDVRGRYSDDIETDEHVLEHLGCKKRREMGAGDGCQDSSASDKIERSQTEGETARGD